MSEVAIIDKSLEKGLEVVTKLKHEIDLLGSQCLLIKVVDDTTLSVAQQNLSKANQMAKFIDDKLTLAKAPYWAACKVVDKLKKEIPEKLDSGITHLKLEVKNFETARIEQEKAKQAEIDRKLAEESAALKAEMDRKQAIQDYINNTAIPTLKKMYEACMDIATCEAKLKAIETGFKPREFFEEFADQAYLQRDNYIELIKAKKNQYESADTMSDAEKEVAKYKEEIAIQKAQLAEREASIKLAEEKLKLNAESKQRELEAEREKELIASEALMNKTKNVRYNWKFELVDLSQVPKEWLTLDEAAVKAFIKENKDKLAEEVRGGVKFYKEMSVIS